MRAIFISALVATVALQPTTADAGRKKKRARSAWSFATPKKHRTASDDGSCSCTSGKLCTGPRGGQYCITSGGNKRYP